MTPRQLKERRVAREWSLKVNERREMLRQMTAEHDEFVRKADESKRHFEEQQQLIDKAIGLVTFAMVNSTIAAFAGCLAESERKA